MPSPKLEIPKWFVAIVVVVVVLAIGFFMNRKVNDDTVGSVTLPGPPPAATTQRHGQ